MAPGTDRVGIVCPVYFLGLPVMVEEFAAHLDLYRSVYTFSVVTYGGSGASSALRQLEKTLKEKHGRALDAGFMVKMPGNYILMYESPSGEKREQILAAADEQLDRIITAVKNSTKSTLPFSPFAWLIHALAYPVLHHTSTRTIVNFPSATHARPVAPAGRYVLREISTSSRADRYGNTVASSVAAVSISVLKVRSRREKRRQGGRGTSIRV
jgi:hypothetical protein